MARLLLLLLACASLASAQTFYKVFYNSDTKSYHTVPPYPPSSAAVPESASDLLVASGFLANDTTHTGWYRLLVSGEEGAPDTLMMEGAGFLEGLLTSPLIDDAIANYAMDTSNKTLMDDLAKWFTTWGAWMRSQAETHSDDPYWVHVGLIFNQMDGLVIGHNKACTAPCTPLALVDILLLSPSVMDIITVISGSSPQWATMDAGRAQLEATLRTHCSGLIRRAPDGDVYLGHTTWNMYTGMVRIFKTYQLPLAAKSTSAKTITFSSYPGALYSGDDFIMMPDTALVVSETTNDIFDASLYNLLQPTGSVLTWIRSMVASRMATTAQEWTGIFSSYNSGTYNNQYMVVNYNLVARAAGQPLPPNTLWIVEQIPGFVHSGDVTSFLNRDGSEFWPSYNIPYFEDIYNKSGYPAMAQTSDQFSYEKCARANIFARDAPKVATLDNMLHIMQSNDYKNDPLSLGSPANAISSRFDLLTTKDAFVVGGIDSKIVSLRLLAANKCYAISGPSHQSLPPFAWTGPWAQFPHAGQADVFNFNYTLMSF